MQHAPHDSRAAEFQRTQGSGRRRRTRTGAFAAGVGSTDRAMPLLEAQGFMSLGMRRLAGGAWENMMMIISRLQIRCLMGLPLNARMR